MILASGYLVFIIGRRHSALHMQPFARKAASMADVPILESVSEFNTPTHNSYRSISNCSILVDSKSFVQFSPL